MTQKTQITLNEARKVELFHNRFRELTDHLVRGWKNEYELALALGDNLEAAKEKLKIDAMHHIQRLAQEASHEASLSALIKTFNSRVEAVRKVLEQRINEAKVSGNKEKEINFRIELGIYEGPPQGFIWSALKELGEEELYGVINHE